MAERVLSCFIDESGDFGPYELHSPYYLVSVVLHDQRDDIKDKISVMEARTANEGFKTHAIHTGPLIRREGVYINELYETRKHLFNILFYFALHIPYRYFCIKLNKKHIDNNIKQAEVIRNDLQAELLKHKVFWEQFDRIIIYYDNGQTELTKIIYSVFFSRFTNVEMRRVKPADYKLFQVADLCCTIELIHEKEKHNEMTRSEMDFFNGRQNFKKDYYKKLKQKRLD